MSVRREQIPVAPYEGTYEGTIPGEINEIHLDNKNKLPEASAR